jgi:hypothetical protein
MIPFNAPPVVGTEIEYMQSAMNSGKLCGDGGFTRHDHFIARLQIDQQRGHLQRRGAGGGQQHFFTAKGWSSALAVKKCC